MKRLLSFLFVVILIVALCLIGMGIKGGKEKEDYLRIHIRANSNSERDQDIKYEIKDKIVEYLTPIISTCETREEFESKLASQIPQIVCIANEILAQNNFDYKSNASVRSEYFPTRTYGSLTLQAGQYEALILNLGSGEGDNWWCVVYPPLCFINGDNIVYKSRLLEVIKNFFGVK